MSREVILYTRSGCGLCDEAASDLRRLGSDLDFNLVERDIDADPALRAAYDERVPVIAIGGRVVAEAPIEPAGLRERLRAALG